MINLDANTTNADWPKRTDDHVRSAPRPRAAGGPGSGNFGHSGRPGEQGGSSSTEDWLDKPVLKSEMERIDSEIQEMEDKNTSSPGEHEYDSRAHISTVLEQAIRTPLSQMKDWRFAYVRSGGRIVAAGSITRISKDVAEVKNVGSIERGSGKKIMEELLRRAGEWKVKEIELVSTARKFYESLGFVQSGSRMRIRVAGGLGSGNFGHAGRPGAVGGSGGADGGSGTGSSRWSQPTDRAGRPIPIKAATIEEAVALIHQGKVVEVKDVATAHTLISKLADMALEAKAAGQAAKDYDLCQVSVPGTNMFCAESLRAVKVGGKDYAEGIPRLEMPQLGGLPVAGSEADRLPKDEDGKVDGSAAFTQHLKDIGLETKSEQVPASHLKASQREIIGSKVGGMMSAKQYDPGRKPIFVSSDGYVIDGHHRWAAVVGRDAEDGRLGDSKMNIVRINAPISEVLHLSNEWSKKFGIKQAAGVKAAYARYQAYMGTLRGLQALEVTKALGGPGSGNFGHEGRPGERGGSGSMTITMGAIKKSKHGGYGRTVGTTVVTVPNGPKWEQDAHSSAAEHFKKTMPGLKLTTEVVKVHGT